MQMAVELDVFVGNTTIMDEEVYQLWLDGYTGTVGDIIHLKYPLSLSTTVYSRKLDDVISRNTSVLELCDRTCERP